MFNPHFAKIFFKQSVSDCLQAVKPILEYIPHCPLAVTQLPVGQAAAAGQGVVAGQAVAVGQAAEFAACAAEAVLRVNSLDDVFPAEAFVAAVLVFVDSPAVAAGKLSVATALSE
jgi:hypothetical protein